MTTLTVQAHDIPDGGMKSFKQGDALILLTRDGDTLRAFDGQCPHAGADLGKGVRCGDRVVCPWHHATFQADSGELLEPPALQGLKAYAVQQGPDGWTVDTTQTVTPSDPAPQRQDEHVLIVGGGASGFMAAHTLRSGGFAGCVTLISDEARAPYDRTALSKGFLTGKTPEAKLPLGGADWATEQHIDLRLNTRVDAVNRQAGTVRLDTGEELSADHLIVATGAFPKRLEITGARLEGVHVLRSYDDAERLRSAAQGKAVVVIGSNFIGLEAAASLISGVARSVSVVGQSAEILSKALTPRVGRAIRQLHEDKGVKFHLNAEVTAFEGEDRVTGVRLGSGETVPAELVLLGVGVTPDTRLLADRADEKGAVHVGPDLTLDAAGPGPVQATGDIAAAPTVLGEMRVEHWRVALQHGLVAAHTLLGHDTPDMAARVPFFWTQQYGKSLRYVGHADSLDDTHLWGDPDRQDFLEFTFAQGRTVAVSGMGRDRELAAAEELLRLGRMPERSVIEAGAFSLADRLNA